MNNDFDEVAERIPILVEQVDNTFLGAFIENIKENKQILYINGTQRIMTTKDGKDGSMYDSVAKDCTKALNAAIEKAGRPLGILESGTVIKNFLNDNAIVIYKNNFAPKEHLPIIDGYLKNIDSLKEQKKALEKKCGLLENKLKKTIIGKGKLKKEINKLKEEIAGLDKTIESGPQRLFDTINDIESKNKQAVK